MLREVDKNLNDLNGEKPLLNCLLTLFTFPICDFQNYAKNKI